MAHYLLHNLLLFGRLLRRLGLDVNPGRVIDLLQALDYVPLGHKRDFYYTARSLLVHRKEDLALFDQAFELFWRKRGDYMELSLADLIAGPPPPAPKPLVVPPGVAQEVPTEELANSEPPQTIIELTRTYSNQELLRHKNFSQLTYEELQQVKELMAQLVWEMGQRQTRRFRPGQGQQLDLRRLLRANLRYGSEILAWPRRKAKTKPRPIIIIADISGSMEQYTRLLLQFIYSLAEGLTQPVEAFVFSTRLTRVTRQLSGRDIDQALADVSHIVHDWAGGTRIGESLKNFNFQWGRRVLGRGAIVLIISDGWDRGDPALLSQEMARLQRTCHRLIWLNPLLGSTSYEPLTRGIQAALPHIDDFLPVHNLASLEDLATHLAALDMSRPGRTIQTRGAAFTGRG